MADEPQNLWEFASAKYEGKALGRARAARYWAFNIVPSKIHDGVREVLGESPRSESLGRGLGVSFKLCEYAFLAGGVLYLINAVTSGGAAPITPLQIPHVAATYLDPARAACVSNWNYPTNETLQTISEQVGRVVTNAGNDSVIVGTQGEALRVATQDGLNRFVNGAGLPSNDIVRYSKLARCVDPDYWGIIMTKVNSTIKAYFVDADRVIDGVSSGQRGFEWLQGFYDSIRAAFVK